MGRVRQYEIKRPKWSLLLKEEEFGVSAQLRGWPVATIGGVEGIEPARLVRH